MTCKQVQGPWTIQQYGAKQEWDEATNTIRWRYDGDHYTIPEIHVDIHVMFDGSGLRDRYPDGIVQTAEEVREIVALVRAAPRLRDTLAELIQACRDEGVQGMDRLLKVSEQILQYATTPVGIKEGIR